MKLIENGVVIEHNVGDLLLDTNINKVIGYITRFTTDDKETFYVKVYDNDEWKTDEIELIMMRIFIIPKEQGKMYGYNRKDILRGKE